ncbi:HD domain-containing protein, partial [Patescibacteria group bacterium]|nr:HD domain-containing protein [Patescibacteria group bacterium]MBU1703554.1 HD domain-containing protein [Patescibacteria group bacterium]
KKFGGNVAFLVDGVTKVRKEFKKAASSAQKTETLRKIISSIAKDQRVLLIKLLDRLHNMRTLIHIPPDKQHKIARETLDFYVPLAKSISLWELKTDLENLCFMNLRPSQYFYYQKLLNSLAHDYREYFPDIEESIYRAFSSTNIPVKVYIVVLTPYEIHELKKKGVDIKKHFFQIVICTDSEEHCYSALGVVHMLWKPVLKYFNDFIAVPKENHYQALHTSVIGIKGHLLMVLIQTMAMNRYSRKSAPFDFNSVYDLKTSLGHLDEKGSSESYLKSVADEVFCRYVHFFDNEGNRYKLPQGSSIIDFFFYLQEQQKIVSVGAIGALVNDRESPLKQIIQKDDVIEFTAGNRDQKVTPFFLRYAKTSLAKRSIKKALSAQKLKDAVSAGKKVLESELKRWGLPMLSEFPAGTVASVIKVLDLDSEIDLYEKAGRGKIDVSRVVYSLFFHYSRNKLQCFSTLKKQFIMMRIINNRNRVGFVKDILYTFQKFNFSIHEIKGYSPQIAKPGIVELKIRESLTLATFRDIILPLCNALEQVDSVASVQLKLT